RFALAPCVRLSSSPHPIASIWEANQPGRDGAPRGAEGPEYAVVWRAGSGIRVERVDEGEGKGLAALARGAALPRAAGGTKGAAARFLESGLARYVRDGVIAGFA